MFAALFAVVQGGRCMLCNVVNYNKWRLQSFVADYIPLRCVHIYVAL